MAGMFVPLQRAQTWRFHTKPYKFGRHTSANNARIKKQQTPDSWRGRLYINHLPYPRFLTLFILIEWLLLTH